MFNSIKPITLSILTLSVYSSIFAMQESTVMQKSGVAHIPAAMYDLPDGIITYMESLPKLAKDAETVEGKAAAIVKFLMDFGTGQRDLPWRRYIIQ